VQKQGQENSAGWLEEVGELKGTELADKIPASNLPQGLLGHVREGDVTGDHHPPVHRGSLSHVC
jgi:hypothetical protein